MKKLMLIPVLIFITVSASAQAKVRLNAYGSYVFDDGFDVYYDANTYYSGKVSGGAQWGGGIEVMTHPYYSVELLYLNKSTTAPTNFKISLADPARQENFDISLNYIMLAGNGFRSTGKVEGYGGFMLGALISDVSSPSTGKSGSHTSFAWGGRAGANIWTSSKVGIKLQAQVLASSNATGGELYFSYYGPVVLETYSTLWQFGLGGGLTFKLGK
jgi:hypothetical protein